MRKTLRLLEMLTAEYPPPAGHKHQVSLHEGKVQIHLARESSGLTVRLEESDLSTPVDYLFHDIKGMVSKQSIPPRMHYSIPVPTPVPDPPQESIRCTHCGWLAVATEGVMGSTAYRCANVGCGMLTFPGDPPHPSSTH